jgi:hypothetical protein
LANVSGLFLSQVVEYNCSWIKVDWLDACIALELVGAVLVVFLRRWRKNLHNPPANGKQGPIPEKISQTLLINKKQGILD